MNFNHPLRVSDLFPVDLGVDLSALQPEINECKRRFQQDLWNTICNRVIQGKTEWNKASDRAGSGGGKTKSEEKPETKEDEEEESEETAENENNFAGNRSNIVNNARRNGRYDPPGPAPLTWRGPTRPSGPATTRGRGAPLRQLTVPMPRRQPTWAPPPQRSQHLSRQQSHNNDERSQFLYRIRSHGQDSTQDGRNNPRYFPRMRQKPQPPPPQPLQQQHPQLQGNRATNSNHARSFSATSRREILGSYHSEQDPESVDLSEAFEDAQLFVAPVAAWSNATNAEPTTCRGHRTAAAATEATGESSSGDGTTSFTRASGESAFVPLVTGDWFAKQRRPTQP